MPVTALNKNVRKCGFVAWAAAFYEPATEIRLQASQICPAQTLSAADVTKGHYYKPTATDAFRNNCSYLLGSQSAHQTKFCCCKKLNAPECTLHFNQFLLQQNLTEYITLDICKQC